MRPAISEFSYGFALTRELYQTPEMGLRAAPVFPTTFREGQPGGGWDVEIDKPSAPLFVQFKVCDRMVAGTCKEARRGLSRPCYRMHLRSARVSRQHEMLLQLEQEGPDVRYAAPMFHTVKQLNDAFVTGTVRNRSVWMRPSEIGPLPDTDQHHVSFDPQGTPFFFSSEPRRLKINRGFSDVMANLSEKLSDRGNPDLMREVDRLDATVEEIVQMYVDTLPRDRLLDGDRLGKLTPLQRVAYHASVVLECQLLLYKEHANSVRARLTCADRLGTAAGDVFERSPGIQHRGQRVAGPD